MVCLFFGYAAQFVVMQLWVGAGIESFFLGWCCFGLWLNSQRHYTGAKIIGLSSFFSACVGVSILTLGQANVHLYVFCSVVLIALLVDIKSSLGTFLSCGVVPLLVYLFLDLNGNFSDFQLPEVLKIPIPLAISVFYYANILLVFSILGLLMLHVRNSVIAAEQHVTNSTEKIMAQSHVTILAELAAGVSHEVNNPMAIIAGQVGRIRRWQKDPEHVEDISKALSAIEDTVKRVVKVTTSLGRLATREHEFSPAEHSLFEIVTDALALMEGKFRQFGIEIQIMFPRETRIFCSYDHMLQVCVNLVANAADAVAPLQDRWIKFQVNTDSLFDNIQIVDSGLGIKDDVRNKLFTPFFTTKAAGQGPGLGLVISSQIIRRHGGFIRYIPTSENTTFAVSLPRIRPT
jgi:signal transduction histidine kinase